MNTIDEIRKHQEEQARMYNPDNSPESNIRTDMWPTMGLSQLARQQELVIDKISKVHQILGPTAGPSIQSIYAALQMALQDINGLIDSRTKQ